MSAHGVEVTVDLDPDLVAYAEQVVGTGKAESVSAVVNEALRAKLLGDGEYRRLLREQRGMPAAGGGGQPA